MTGRPGRPGRPGGTGGDGATGGTGGSGGDDLEVRSADEPVVVAPDEPIVAADDVLELGPTHHHGPQRPSRWSDRMPAWVPAWIVRPPRVPTAALLVGIIVGVAIAIAVMGGQHTKVVVAPSPSATATGEFAVGNPSLAAMIDLASTGETLQDFTIADDTRPRCPPGSAQFPDPVNAVVAVVHSWLPDFTLVDASRGIDLAGVCSIRVRERSPAGPILVVSVDSPPNSGGVPWVLIENNDTDTLIDVLAITDGWRIEVLTSGVTGLQPRSTDLQNIVADPRVVW